MTDVFSKAKRSEIMSRIRGRGNERTEMAFVRVLRRNHIKGWRRNRPIFGKPDFVFPKNRVAVFVDGCFWHGCPRHATSPQNNREFWVRKIRRNVARDRLVTRTLRSQGWRVLRIWQHDLKRPHEKGCVRRIAMALGASMICSTTNAMSASGRKRRGRGSS